MFRLKIYYQHNNMLIEEKFYNKKENAINYAVEFKKNHPNRYSHFYENASKEILDKEGWDVFDIASAYGMFYTIDIRLDEIKFED